MPPVFPIMVWLPMPALVPAAGSCAWAIDAVLRRAVATTKRMMCDSHENEGFMVFLRALIFNFVCVCYHRAAPPVKCGMNQLRVSAEAKGARPHFGRRGKCFCTSSGGGIPISGKRPHKR